MNSVDFILAKRRGQEHSLAELEAFLGAYLTGEVRDYQASAWLMAVCFRGMTDTETADLTRVMARSGDMLDLTGLPYPVDKHSTGGVGDKTSLVLAPLLAEAGATVAKMSGRGLGHTGGTVDKLESIKGFRSALSDAEFLRIARELRVVISGQSTDMAPLDGMLYALRDATGTVDSLPLIASSIMSKKLAGGARSLVLDVKVGSGAFMKTLDDATNLARSMLQIGRHAGLSVRAVLSGMTAPLGAEIGNAGEVLEAAACLRGEGPEDLTDLSLELAAQVLAAAGIPRSTEELRRLLTDGTAHQRFVRWIEAQGGDAATLDSLPLAPGEHVITAGRSGHLSRLDALSVGRAVSALGGGRQFKDQEIDHGVGVRLLAKPGDEVSSRQPLMLVRHRDGRGLEAAVSLLESALGIGGPSGSEPLILGVIEG